MCQWTHLRHWLWTHWWLFLHCLSNISQALHYLTWVFHLIFTVLNCTQVIHSRAKIKKFILPRGLGYTFPLYLESLLIPLQQRTLVQSYKNNSLHFNLYESKGRFSHSNLILPFNIVKRLLQWDHKTSTQHLIMLKR